MFAHGGVLPSHVEYGVDRINRETHQWMLGEAKNKPEFLQGKDAVVWSRHYSAENQARCECDKLTEALDKVRCAAVRNVMCAALRDCVDILINIP